MNSIAYQLRSIAAGAVGFLSGIAIALWMAKRLNIDLVAGGSVSGFAVLALILLTALVIVIKPALESSSTRVAREPSVVLSTIWTVLKTLLNGVSALGIVLLMGNPVGPVEHQILVDERWQLAPNELGKLGETLRALSLEDATFEEPIKKWLTAPTANSESLARALESLGDQQLEVRLSRLRTKYQDSFGHRITVVSLYRTPSSDLALRDVWPVSAGITSNDWKVIEDPDSFKNQPKILSYRLIEHPMIRSSFSMTLKLPPRVNPPTNVTVKVTKDTGEVWTCSLQPTDDKDCLLESTQRPEVSHSGNVYWIEFPLPSGGTTLQVMIASDEWKRSNLVLDIGIIPVKLQPRTIPINPNLPDGAEQYLLGLKRLRSTEPFDSRPVEFADTPDAIPLSEGASSRKSIQLRTAKPTAGCTYSRSARYLATLPDVWLEAQYVEGPAVTLLPLASLSAQAEVWVKATCSGTDYAIVLRETEGGPVVLMMPDLWSAPAVAVSGGFERLLAHLVVTAGSAVLDLDARFGDAEMRPVRESSPASTTLEGTRSLTGSVALFLRGSLDDRPDRKWSNDRKWQAASIALAPLVLFWIAALFTAFRRRLR